jgi:hypothetical protein
MGRVSPTKRKMAIAQKRKKQKKLKKLRQKYLAAKTSEEKSSLLEKVYRLAPWLTKKKFLAPIKESQKK